MELKDFNRAKEIEKEIKQLEVAASLGENKTICAGIHIGTLEISEHNIGFTEVGLPQEFLNNTRNVLKEKFREMCRHQIEVLKEEFKKL